MSYTSEYHLPGIFIEGLQYELQSEVRDGLKYLRVIDLEAVKNLALKAEERLAELDRLAEIKRRRMMGSRKPERSRAGNGPTCQSDVGGLNRVEEDPWKKLDSMLEKVREMIKGSKTILSTHIEAAPSLQETGTGSTTPLRESNKKQFENLSNGRSGKFKQLSEVEFQFRRDKGICFRCDERFHPNHRCKIEDVEPMCDRSLVHTDLSNAKDEAKSDEKPGEEASNKEECNEKKSEEPDVVECVAVKDEDRAPNAAEFSTNQEHVEEEEPLQLVELAEKDKETELFVIPHVKKLTVPVVYFFGFVLGSIRQEIILDSSQSVESVGYLEEAWDFICTMPFKPGLSSEAIFISALPR